MYRSLHFQSKAIIFIAVLLVITAAIFFVRTHRAVFFAELSAMKLVPKHEPFTELYFEDFQNIPKVIVSGQTYSFLFVIHNLENKDMSYPYTVYVQSQSGGRTMITSGTLVVRDGAYAMVPVSYALQPVPQKAEVFVDLSEMHQELHFTIVGAQ